MVIDQSLAYASFEKLPPLEDERKKKHKDPYADFIQRMRNLLTLNAQRDVSMKFFPLCQRERCDKGGRNGIKAKKGGRLPSKQGLLNITGLTSTNSKKMRQCAQGMHSSTLIGV